MTAEISKSEKALEISDKILKNACSAILVNMRFLDSALFRLKFKASGISLATDGRFLYYNPQTLMNTYAKEPNAVNRELLHVLLHCVFRHLFVGSGVDKRYWSLACDMAVEDILCGLDLAALETESTAQIAKALAPFKKKIYPFTAEKIYRHLFDNTSLKQVQRLEEIFYADDHTLWYFNAEEASVDKSDDGAAVSAPQKEALKKAWDDISRHVQLDLDTFSKKIGKRSGDLLFQLQNVNREKYDYGEFLKKFSVMGESIKVNDDEFDYVYYTYGLSLYENMPLIEPLEYKEEKRIKEFVIAIDTSGSVAGSLVHKFLQKTWDILKNGENFFTKINMYIIQCDAKLQDIARITCQEDFDAYMKDLKIKGAGGTDFRPVFAYVNDLVREGEFLRLKGLIYFTDGYGTFPEKKPDYDAAFVFLRNEYDNPSVPPWAIKLVLDDV